MPELRTNSTELIIKSNQFQVTYENTNPHYFTVHLDSMSQGFFIAAGCDSFEQKDLCYLEQIDFQIKAFSHFIRLTFKYKSTIWDKTYYLDVYDSHIEFYYDLFGTHRISNLHFFEGINANGFEEHYFTKHFNDHKVTPYREYSTASPVSFKKVFNPEPNVYHKQYFDFYEYSQISVNSDFSDYCGGNFLFNPGIFCFLISKDSSSGWLSLGLAVKPGEYFFSEYEYVGGNEFGLNLNYCGLNQVDGIFQTPKIIIYPGNTEIETLEKYITYLKENNLTPRKQRTIHDWWRGPIISGIGHQCYQADLFRIRSPRERQRDLAGYFMCTQVNYEDFVSRIDSYRLNWKILVIDVRWYINAGLKQIDLGRWPDMRGFVDKLHKRGKKVLIWWGPWKTEGWNTNECIVYSVEDCGPHRNRPGRFSKFGEVYDGVKIAPDITLPSVQKKVRKQLEHLLGDSDGCVDLDGLKLDHTAETPALYGLKFPKGSKQLYGVELLRYYHAFLYDAVKQIKGDALIVGQSPNPYFADCIDMIRLGDTYSHTKDSIIEQMSFRHKMATIVDSAWLIDMDGWPMPSLKAFHEYAEFQVIHGVPSLYYATHLDTTGEVIPNHEWVHIRKLWNQYANMGANS